MLRSIISTLWLGNWWRIWPGIPIKRSPRQGMEYVVIMDKVIAEYDHEPLNGGFNTRLLVVYPGGEEDPIVILLQSRVSVEL